MANFYEDNEDLKFYVEKYIDWDKLVDLVELHFKATDAPQDVHEAVDLYRDILQLAGEFVANEVAPRARAMDAGHAEVVDGKVVVTKEFEEVFDQLKEMGIYGMTVPRELGGMNLPLLIYFLVAELMGRGDAGATTHLGFHAGIAASLVEYSIREGSATFDDEGRIQSTRWDNYLSQILSGDAWGSMDLTEPDAGSDLAALRCRARQDENGVWRLTGNKIFITSGHGKFHLVLAKTSDEVSLDALSMFVVPSEIERDGEIIKNVEVDRVEDKIGHHSSVTASVQFDESEGELIGKAGEGFQLMLMLMNNARIGVGFESLGLGEAAYRMAREYAAERPSMGKTIDRHEMIADYLDEMEVTLLGVRALAVEGAISEETHTRIADFDIAGVAPVPGQDLGKVAQRAKRRARLLTPLLKYAAAEAAVHLCRLNMQIHGGNGYSSEFGAERLLRDSLVLPIYEGTSQIQALMALKDHLGFAIKRPQQFVQRLARAKYNAVRVRDNLERRYWGMRSLALSAQQHILLQIAKEKLTTARAEPLPKFLNTFLKNWDPKRDFSFGLLHAEHLIKILADVEIAHLLLEQAKKFPERREIAERWLERAEPRVRYNWDLITTTGDRIVELVRRADAEVEAEESAAAAPH
jgi:alkylation response protein AidB-like acyl-CoA dehydrogenase